jgi:hypothetical protein
MKRRKLSFGETFRLLPGAAAVFITLLACAAVLLLAHGATVISRVIWKVASGQT